ncbi:50S ribosomal protein L11 methyltransferase [Sphingobium sufflavum]|uniref:50S ribosomal protein L11 methyltransferase n=1 Tax=Sphingobium sufflavum TaxID=1129547 RepID=UPI001F303673|nr:50S ribosomal protein L11 methyltransferase [Sphingobium sufflavum]MCE7797576.1 50S ribosomal protein L11 methyltransferase [Sphingobium sufflavum]
MSDTENDVWMATLPCARVDAERIDAEAEILFADSATPPIFSFVEASPDNPDDWLLQVYFHGKPGRALLKQVRDLLPGAAAPKVEQVVAQDWVAVSQEGLPPITAGRFHVRNGVDDPPSTGHVNFLIPASRAFGTGQHETTHGCLEMLDRLRARGQRFGNIADVGTGTGLLAFAALALWPRAHAIASDIDPASVEVTVENIALNGLREGGGAGEMAVVEAAGMDHEALAARAPYDLLIANILAGPLISLAPAFAAHLAEGGSLVLAGLLDEQADAVIAACQRAGLRLAARTQRGQWPTLHLRKRHRHGHRRPERWGDSGDSVAPGFGSW